MGLAFLVWVSSGLLKRDLHFLVMGLVSVEISDPAPASLLGEYFYQLFFCDQESYAKLSSYTLVAAVGPRRSQSKLCKCIHKKEDTEI